MILGIDEVGRGPWAGPLVVGAVVLGSTAIEGLTDSKKLSKQRRRALDQQIRTHAAGVGLGWVWPDEIDRIGLTASLRQATRQAVRQIQAPFHEIIIDGTANFLVDTPLESHVTVLKKADLLIQSVSAASIVAKVARDNYMAQQAELYPDYGFDSHVGYGTVKHRHAIEANGVTPLHRLSFGPLKKYATKKQPSSRAAPSTTTRSIGDRSETVAAKELEARGHRIIERNWKTKYCEIDIVSQKDDVVYFSEVKHRQTNQSGSGLEAITPKKLAQMRFAATLYAHLHSLQETSLRLLAVATQGEDPIVTDIVEAE